MTKNEFEVSKLESIKKKKQKELYNTNETIRRSELIREIKRLDTKIARGNTKILEEKEGWNGVLDETL